MANHFEALNAERQALVEDAMGPVFDALFDLDNGQREGVSLGDINNRVRETHPGRDFGMGIIPTALDVWESEGEVTCIEIPVSPSKNGHMIGKPEWKTLAYQIKEPPLSVQIAR